MRPDEHLDLVELVHTEDATRVLAVGSSLAAEARREAGVAKRQHRLVDAVATVHASERDLCSADQVQIVFGDPVHLMLVSREEARVDHHLFAHQHGRHHRNETAGDELRQRVLHECELDLHRATRDVGESAAADGSAELVVDPTEVTAEVGVIHRWRGVLFADGRNDRAFVFAAVRHRRVCRDRQLQRERLHLVVDDVVVRLGGRQFGLDQACGLDLRRPLLGRSFADLLGDGVGAGPGVFDGELQVVVAGTQRDELIDQVRLGALALDACSIVRFGEPLEVDHPCEGTAPGRSELS